MFGLSLKTLAVSAALSAAGVGFGLLKEVQAQKAARALEAAEFSLNVLRANHAACTARLSDIQEDQASDREIDAIPDDLLPGAVRPEWMLPAP